MFPGTGEQRCWSHTITNVLNCLPESAHPGAKPALAEIRTVEDGEDVQAAAMAFVSEYGVKWPKEATKITGDTMRPGALF